MTYDLFISHSSVDAETAQALVTDFENRNISCWIAPRDIPMGSSYQAEILRAINNCRAVLLLFSKATNDSEHVLREVELAAQGRKPIYPLRIDATEPAGGLKYMLANKQWVERKALGNRLVDTIEQLLGSSRAAPADAPLRRAEPPKKPGLSPALIGAVVVCLLLGGGVAAWQGDWFGIEARKEQVRKVEQAKKEDDDRRVAEAKRLEDEKKIAEAKKADDEKKAAEAQTAEAERKAAEERRKAAIAAPESPFKKADDPDILKAAPTIGEAVPGKTFFRECDMCPVMAVIPGGMNIIGSPKEELGHESGESEEPVSIRVPLAVGRSEVSFDQYLACIAEGGCGPERPADHDWGTGTRPVIFVSWDDAKRYVAWLSQKTRARYRLLSEAEWEYAARGCAKVCELTPFWFGDKISKTRANYDWRIVYVGAETPVPLLRTVPIDELEANRFGLLNVHGNVAEWVEDCWNDFLAGISRDGTARTSGDCSRHVYRGGSWKDGPKALRSAKRSWALSTDRRDFIGLRVARELQM